MANRIPIMFLQLNGSWSKVYPNANTRHDPTLWSKSVTIAFALSFILPKSIFSSIVPWSCTVFTNCCSIQESDNPFFPKSYSPAWIVKLCCLTVIMLCASSVTENGTFCPFSFFVCVYSCDSRISHSHDIFTDFGLFDLFVLHVWLSVWLFFIGYWCFHALLMWSLLNDYGVSVIVKFIHWAWLDSPGFWIVHFILAIFVNNLAS